MLLPNGALLSLDIELFEIAPRCLHRRRIGRELDGMQLVLARVVQVIGKAADDSAL
jgi:hypothetical protein